jgi:hypothetical protein
VLAVRAAATVGGGLVGVDLIPEARGWRVIEINGAVDFTDEYALDDRDVFGRAVEPFAPSSGSWAPCAQDEEIPVLVEAASV